VPDLRELSTHLLLSHLIDRVLRLVENLLHLQIGLGYKADNLVRSAQ
jgi:hypothetical protein